MIDWVALEQRGQKPTPKQVTQAVKAAQNLPSAGDAGHVQAVFPIYGKGLPSIDPDAWTKKAKAKKVRLRDLQATNAQLDRKNLIWHLKRPGQARYRSARNTYPQVLKTKKGDLAIVDGHHRLSALSMFGIKKTQVWLLKEKDL